MTYQETPPAQYDFTNFPNDLFQPEEIFQLDQPIRPDYNVAQNEIARSPPTLLDLGSGTIHREYKNEEYWMQNQIINDDSNNSSCSRYLNQSPESRDITLNNNLNNEIDRLQFVDPKANEVNQCKYKEDYYQLEEYRPENFTEVIDNRVFYPQEQQSFEYDFKTYRYPDVRVQEKNELVDLDLQNYTYEAPYENKIVLNESIDLNDLDYRMQCGTTGHFQEGFENIMSTSN